MLDERLKRFNQQTSGACESVRGLNILRSNKKSNKLRPVNVAGLAGSSCQHPYTLCVNPNEYIAKKRYIVVPCGQCPACLARSRKMWTDRVTDEYNHSDYAAAFDITYNNANLPLFRYDVGNTYHSVFPRCVLNGYAVSHYNTKPYSSCNLAHDRGYQQYNMYYPALVRSDLSAFIKLCRRWLNGIVRLTSFGVGEYGSKYCRPHYHLMLFYHAWPNPQDMISEKVAYYRNKLENAKRPKTQERYSKKIADLTNLANKGYISKELVYLLLPASVRANVALSAVPAYGTEQFFNWITRNLSAIWTKGQVNVKYSVSPSYARYLGKYFAKIDANKLTANDNPLRWFYPEFRLVSRGFGYGAFEDFLPIFAKQYILNDNAPFEETTYKLAKGNGKYRSFPRAYWLMYFRRTNKAYHYHPSMGDCPHVQRMKYYKYEAFCKSQDAFEEAIINQTGLPKVPDNIFLCDSDGNLYYNALDFYHMAILEYNDIYDKATFRPLSLPRQFNALDRKIKADCEQIQLYALTALEDHIRNR